MLARKLALIRLGTSVAGKKPFRPNRRIKKKNAMNSTNSDLRLARSITLAASKQTYATIRFLVDRELVADAYRAYAYFRWVDDTLDAETGTRSDRSAFLQRQRSILERGYRGEPLREASLHEKMLVDLIRSDRDKNSGLQSYLRNMMAVMAFDAERRGRLISQSELNAYTRWLASGVTEAMHYFIGHGSYSPHNEARYRAVTAAHITHMLRDTFDDVRAGYFNIPQEALQADQITPAEVGSDVYRLWVRSRVSLARANFQAGRGYLHQVENLRCRIAGFAYMARFEWLLDTIEREGYRLRPQYDERKRMGTSLRMGLKALASFYPRREADTPRRSAPRQERSLRDL